MYFYFKLEDILVVIMYVVLVIENEEVIKVVQIMVLVDEGLNGKIVVGLWK